jgi:hypothetical protein
LDSASERSYQTPFCQALAAQGHRIVHSTRHGPIEYGKDVITIGPDGLPNAYQLKGNPGTRLTLNEYRGIEAQLFELVSLPLAHPSIHHAEHRAFLVTNGLVEEEVLEAIRRMNEGFVAMGFPRRRLEVLQRGDLLAIFNTLGSSLWPSELHDTNLLLSMMTDDGRDMYPVKKLDALLVHLFGLADADPRRNGRQVQRTVTSAGILISASLRNYARQENHYAVLTAWTIFATYAIAACEKHGVSVRNALASLTIADAAIKDALVALLKEVVAKQVATEGDPMVDFVFYRARYTLLLGLGALLWLWCEKDANWPHDLSKDAVESFLNQGQPNLYCWGEGAIPQLLLYYWYLTRAAPGAHSHMLVVALLSAIGNSAVHDEDALQSPYYSFGDVARHQLAPILGRSQDPLRDENAGGASFFAEALMHLLVRTGFKQACKRVWSGLTRATWMRFDSAEPWQFCLWRSRHGRYTTHVPVFTKQWADLVQEARSVQCHGVPRALRDRELLLALFVLLCPYRATPNVVRRLGWQFGKGWFIDDPIEV